MKALFEYSEHRKDTIRAYAVEALGYLATDEAVAVTPLPGSAGGSQIAALVLGIFVAVFRAPLADAFASVGSDAQVEVIEGMAHELHEPLAAEHAAGIAGQRQQDLELVAGQLGPGLAVHQLRRGLGLLGDLGVALRLASAQRIEPFAPRPELPARDARHLAKELAHDRFREAVAVGIGGEQLVELRHIVGLEPEKLFDLLANTPDNWFMGISPEAFGAVGAASPGLRWRAGQALSASAGPPGAEWVRVERVVDGDTLVVTGERTVRVLAIDTPETVNPGLAGPDFDFAELRAAWNGIYMTNFGYDKSRANAELAAGEVDLVAFGVPYLANPDLPERLRQDAPLNEPDPASFYGGDARGYTDYPFLGASA